MKIFSPSTIHSLVAASQVAVVRVEAGSEPPIGSVSPIAIGLLAQRAYCSGAPAIVSTVLPRE